MKHLTDFQEGACHIDLGLTLVPHSHILWVVGRLKSWNHRLLGSKDEEGSDFHPLTSAKVHTHTHTLSRQSLGRLELSQASLGADMPKTHGMLGSWQSVASLPL